MKKIIGIIGLLTMLSVYANAFTEINYGVTKDSYSADGADGVIATDKADFYGVFISSPGGATGAYKVYDSSSSIVGSRTLIMEVDASAYRAPVYRYKHCNYGIYIDYTGTPTVWTYYKN